MAKVLEKAAFQQLYDYLNLNCLLSPNLSDYKQNYSCETALFAIVNDLQVVIHNDNLAAVVMLDLSAVFDTIDHQRLLFNHSMNHVTIITQTSNFTAHNRKKRLLCEYTTIKKLNREISNYA